MFQAKLRGWRLLAAGLVLAPSFTGLGADALGLLSRARADERPMVASRVDEARELMRQARAELNANNFGKAKQLAEQARAMQAPAQFYDDNPEDILADISKKSGTKPSRPAKPATTDPRALMEMAKQAMDHGDIERAQDLVMQAQANSASVRWGLFEDTPSSLMKDIQKVKSRRDRDMSERMITEARMLLEKKATSKVERAKNIATAEERARTAEKLHGPYSVWDFGDKPMDIFSEARVIREKEQLPAAMAQGKTHRDSAVTQASAKLNPDDMPVRSGSGDPVAANTKATGLMKEAVGLMNGGNFAEARVKLIEAAKLNASFGRDEDTPEIVLGNLNILAQRKMSKLCDEARECISRKDTVAARSKLDEAEQIASSMKLDAGRVHDLRVSLKPTKPTQSEVVNDSLPPLAPVPTKTTKPAITVASADDLPPPVVRSGKGSEPDMKLPVIKNGNSDSIDLPLIKNGTGEPAPAPLIKSEKPEPTAAPLIKNGTPEKATGGNVDLVLPLPVDSKPEAKPSITKIPAPAPAADRGLELLEKARLELRNGQIESARKICVTILAGSFTCKGEAEALLNSIDTQEVEQKKVTSRRAFENGLASMNAQNYSQALAIFKEIDPAMLPANKRMQLDEAISAAESKQKALVALAQGKATVNEKGTLPAPVPVAPTTKVGEDSLLKQQEALSQVEFQKLRSESLKVESSATARFGRGETDAAVKDLQDFVKKVQASNLDKSKQALLVRPIEARLDRLLILKHQSDFLTKEAKDQANFKREMTQEALVQQKKNDDIAKLMKEVVKLNDQAKHKEAYVLVQKAHQIDPDNVTVNAQMQITELLFRKGEFARVKKDQEKFLWNEVQEMWESPQVSSKDPIVFSKDDEHLTRMKNRGNGTFGTNRMRSEKDKMLERKMLSNVTINFKAVPLESVVEHLATTTNLNFNLDYAGLKEGGVDPKLPITAKLESVSLKSAMEIICQQAGLKHLIENEAIRVTTAKNAAGRQRRVTISVGELVIPTPSFGAAPGSTLNEQLRMAQLSAQGGNLNSATPRNGNLPGGMGIGSGTDSASAFPNASGRLNNGPREGGVTNGISHTGTLEKELINLITSTIKPDTWRSMGGEGTIEYFPTGMALVVNQSPEVIEEVERLLESLRKLQDLEVSIEIKVVSLSETFYERIGVDFSMGIPTNARAGTGNPAFINSGSFSGNVVGMQAPGVATPDLDIPIRATSFAKAIPPFGGFSNTFADGGISLGLAFLNDCQVQMFLEAAQGDTRTNVMQAPKLTALNGTSASMTVGDVQFFLTGINVASVAGQLVFQPVNTPFQVGITQPVPPNASVQNGLLNFTPQAPQTPGLGLFIQPVVSADRRFVRLNVQQSFTSLVSGTQQVPITTVITPVFENGGQGQPVPLTQYLQQPRFSNLETQTVVVVPDGGTVVMGGLKYMTEGRMEFGPPVLGKIPYLNRLFRNVAYGREARSILIMVTPRIIINREEQERQTGVREDDYIGEALGNR